jgi:hypothetical protein
VVVTQSRYIPAFSLRERVVSQKFRTTGVRTKYVLNTSSERYRYANLLEGNILLVSSSRMGIWLQNVFAADAVTNNLMYRNTALL